MAGRAPPPMPEEYKGKTPAPPPPSSPPPGTRARPDSQSRIPPPAPLRTASDRTLRPDQDISRARPNSLANRAPPPTPSMADLEDIRHAAPVARPPAMPKTPVMDWDNTDGPKKPFLRRKLTEYRTEFRRCQKSHHAIERAVICAIAIALLWLTCLALCQAIVNYFIRAPRTQSVINAADTSLTWTSEVKGGYENCSSRLIDFCSSQIQSDIAIENLRVYNIQVQNNITLATLFADRDKCNAQLNFGITSLALLQSNYGVTSPKDSFPTNYSFTDPRCLLVDEQIRKS